MMDYIVVCFVLVLFFFFKQKTAYERRISDWISDVCSSDLDVDLAVLELGDHALARLLLHVAVQRGGVEAACRQLVGQLDRLGLGAHEDQHAVEGFRLEDAGQRVELVHAGDQPVALADIGRGRGRSEEHTSVLQSLMRISYAVFCLKKKT